MDRLCRLLHYSHPYKLGRGVSLLECRHWPPSFPGRWQQRFISKQSQDDTPVDAPLPFTKSKAYTYRASQNFRVTQEEMTYPNYTSFVVKASVVIMLIYFCILREPNDIDQDLGRDLFEIVPELEVPMLESEVRRLEKMGINADDIRKKIEEVKLLKSQAEATNTTK